MGPERQQSFNTKTNNLAIIGFVLSFLLPIIGLIVSIVSLGKLKNNNEKGRGLAIAGIVVSLVLTAVSLLIMIIVFAMVPSAQKNSSDTARRNDAMMIVADISNYQSVHNGNFAQSVEEMTTTKRSYIENIIRNGQPTMQNALFNQGVLCDGQQGQALFSVKIIQQDGTVLCVDPYGSASQ